MGRHYYFRLAAGIIWLIGAVVSLICGSPLFAAFELFMGVFFLSSAHGIRKRRE